MTKHPFFHVVVLACAVLFCCCAASQDQRARKDDASTEKSQNKNEKVSSVVLKKLYDSAASEYEHRAVCLRAIDEGLIRQGGSVSTIDEIFSTHFASKLPTGNLAISNEQVLFAPQPVQRSRSDDGAAGRDSVGWYLAFDYDQKGIIQNYYLTNLHKGNGSPRADGHPSLPDLRRSYENAPSEFDRLAVCLRAIDEGALITYRPVSPVDEIFGTHFSSELPTRTESIRKANIEFLNPKTIDHSSNWILAIEYDFQGTLLNYYLTNVHK